VLVVDDDASNRETLVEVLETEGYLVETVADGLEALEYLRRAPAPDVILLDLMMPRMDGWAFRAEQRRYPSLVTIPTIIMTASAVDTVDHECPLLRKPLALTSLLEALAMALAPAAGRARV
jgi:CheY-like chemotaxis protein